MTDSAPILVLDGTSLTLAALAPLARGEDMRLEIAPAALEAVARSRGMVEEIVARGDIVYGLTTGFGKLKNVAIATDDIEELQENLVLSHCVGIGDDLPANEVRIAQVLRLESLLRGCSGVRVELVEFLARVFNAGFIPVVPQQGSVGASGDLAPLSHMTATYMGYGEVQLAGERMDAASALARIGEPPLVLATSVFAALRHAVHAARVGAGLGAGPFVLDAPATVDRIAAACNGPGDRDLFSGGAWGETRAHAPVEPPRPPAAQRP